MNKLKSKNFTQAERSLFVQLLKQYSHIVERPKADSASPHEREHAWNSICDRYNSSPIITEERTISQLKKLRTNLKQAQKETQAKNSKPRFVHDISVDKADRGENSVGSIPEFTPTLLSKNDMENSDAAPDDGDGNIDYVMIDPSLDVSEPTETLADESTTEDKKNIAQDNDLNSSPDNKVEGKNKKLGEIPMPKLSKLKPLAKSKFTSPRIIIRPEKSVGTPLPTFKVIKPCNIQTLDVDEEKSLKIKRLKFLINQEQELFTLKRKHEEEMNSMILSHTKRKCYLELRAATATAELAELLLKKETMRDSDE